jgi:hypothetical protein
MFARYRKWLVYGLSAVLSIAGLLFLLRSFDVERLQAAFQTVDVRYFLLSLLLVTVSQIIPPQRWKVLLDGAISLRHSAGAIWIGNFVSALVPLRMGEGVRAGLIYRSHAIALSASVPTIIAGQVMDVLSLLALALVLLFTAPLPPELLRASVILAVLTAVGLIIVVVLIRFMPAISQQFEPFVLRIIGEKLYAPIKRFASKIMDSLRVVQDPSRLATALGLSLVFWFVTALAGGAMALSLDQEQVLVLGLMMGFAGGIGRLLPALPGSIGTLDAATLLGLTALGVGETEALALVLLLRLRYTVMIIITGAIGFIIEGRFSLRPVIAETAE